MSSDNIERTLGRMEGKLDGILKALPDHERRIRVLEKWRWLLIGAFAVLSAFFRLTYAR